MREVAVHWSRQGGWDFYASNALSGQSMHWRSTLQSTHYCIAAQHNFVLFALLVFFCISVCLYFWIFVDLYLCIFVFLYFCIFAFLYFCFLYFCICLAGWILVHLMLKCWYRQESLIHHFGDYEVWGAVESFSLSFFLQYELKTPS